jgi:hypothetical protein
MLNDRKLKIIINRYIIPFLGITFLKMKRLDSFTFKIYKKTANKYNLQFLVSIEFKIILKILKLIFIVLQIINVCVKPNI